MLARVIATKPAEWWLDALETAAVPCAPIRTMDEVFASPEGSASVEQVADPAHGGTLQLVASPIRLDGQRAATRRPPPELGEHDGEGW